MFETYGNLSRAELQLAVGRIRPLFMRYAMPGVIAMLFMALQGIVDGLIVGRFLGAKALAAVNIRPLVHHQHPGGGAFQRQLIGGVDAGLAGAQDHHVVIGIHTAAPLLAVGIYGQYIVPWNTPRRKGAISPPPEGRPPSKRYHFQLSAPPSGGDGRPVLNRGAGCDKIEHTPMVLGAFS